MTSPSKAIVARSNAIPPTPTSTDCGPYGRSNGGGGTLSLSERDNHIAVKSAAQATASRSSARAGQQAGRLHAPNHTRHRA